MSYETRKQSKFFLNLSCADRQVSRRYYKFVGYLDIDPTQCHPNYTADIREGVAIEYVSCEPSDSLKELFPEGYGACDDSFEEAKPEQA